MSYCTVIIIQSIISFITQSQRVFEGITVEVGSKVHLDFRDNSIWNRYKAPSSAGDPVWYDTIDSYGTKSTWIYTEGSNGMRFESEEHSGYYLAIKVTSIMDPGPYLIKLKNSNIGAYGEWIPEPVGDGTTMLKNTYYIPQNGLMQPEQIGGCLHLYGQDGDGNDIFGTDKTCTQASSLARRFRIVPRFAPDCNVGSYHDSIKTWYNGLSLYLPNDGTDAWNNLRDNGDDISLATPNNLQITYRNAHPYLQGLQDDLITFKPQLPDDIYTGFFVTRYHATDQQRIIECTSSNCAVGHKDGFAGVLHQDSAYQTSKWGYNDPLEIIMSVVKNGVYRANGYAVKKTSSSTPTHISNDQFCINCYGTQSSPFDIFEAIIIHKKITTSNIQCIESWLADRWNIPLASKDPTPEPTTNPTKSPTPAPSANPTPAPTKNPTASPTPCPTANPTPAPTSDPTTGNPTTTPTNDPTNEPTFTRDPTEDPTTDPTFDPTTDPTYDPTADPTFIPTQTPTNKPTLKITTKHPTGDGQQTEPTTDPTYNTINTEEEYARSDEFAKQEARNIILQNMTVILGGFLFFIIVLSFIYSRKWKQNDFYRLSALITAALHMLDMVSDVSFCLQTTAHPDFNSSTSLFLIFTGSAIFILLPLSLSLYQLHSVINKKWMNASSELKGWIHDNVTILYLLSFLTGSSFTAIELCHSNLFNLIQFDIPLSKREISLFKTLRIYSTIAFENVPQIGLQIWYIAISGSLTGEIVYISLGFSIISILIAVISMFTQKVIINNMDWAEIQFDVIGNDISSNQARCKNIVKTPQREIAGILGVNKNITEILRPNNTPNGLTLKMKLYISISQAIDMNCQKLLTQAKDNGKLSQIFQDAWSLKSVPIIANIKYKQINSKIRNDNTVSIAMTEVVDEIDDNNTDSKQQNNTETKIKNMQNLSEGLQVDGPNALTGDNATATSLININNVPQPNIKDNYPQNINQINSYDSDSSSNSFGNNGVTAGGTDGNL